MINSTQIVTHLMNTTTNSEFIKVASSQIFLKSVVVYWVFQLILTLVIGLALVEKNKGKFWAIFILTQLVGGIILFFTFVFPILPNIMGGI